MNFDASQLQIPQQQQQQQQQQQPQQQQQQGNERVGMAMIPENDFSKLNINSLQQPMNFNYQSVNAFPVTDLPLGPDPTLLLTNCSSSASTSYTTGSSDLNLLLARLDNSAMRTVS
jgi:transcription initiation factor TFIID subunit TAF12